MRHDVSSGPGIEAESSEARSVAEGRGLEAKSPTRPPEYSEGSAAGLGLLLPRGPRPGGPLDLFTPMIPEGREGEEGKERV